MGRRHRHPSQRWVMVCQLILLSLSESPQYKLLQIDRSVKAESCYNDSWDLHEIISTSPWSSCNLSNCETIIYLDEIQVKLMGKKMVKAAVYVVDRYRNIFLRIGCVWKGEWVRRGQIDQLIRSALWESSHVTATKKKKKEYSLCPVSSASCCKWTRYREKFVKRKCLYLGKLYILATTRKLYSWRLMKNW